jgi:hypothetical protein
MDINLTKLEYDNIYILEFNDIDIELTKEEIIQIPYYKTLLKSKIFSLEFESYLFEDLFNFIKTGIILKNRITFDKILLYDYLKMYYFKKKSLELSDKTYLIDNNFLPNMTKEELVLRDFIKYNDKLVFYSLKTFDYYLDNIMNIDIEKVNTEYYKNNYSNNNSDKIGRYGFIHLLILEKYNINFVNIIDKINVNLEDYIGRSFLMSLLSHKLLSKIENPDDEFIEITDKTFNLIKTIYDNCDVTIDVNKVLFIKYVNHFKIYGTIFSLSYKINDMRIVKLILDKYKGIIEINIFKLILYFINIYF